MKLTYRGTNYEFNPTNVTTVPGEVIGQYRGAILKRECHRALDIPSEPLTDLQYRGICYTKRYGIN